MIFAEGTDMNLNYLQPKKFAFFQKLWATEQKSHFLSNNLILRHIIRQALQNAYICPFKRKFNFLHY